MNFLNPGLLGNFEFFKNQFVLLIEKNHEQKPSRVLRSLIQPFVMRRTKNEVARELPAIAQQVIYCNMSESQQAFYETEKSQVRNHILGNIREQGLEKSSFLILQSLTRLRQVANHPIMVDAAYTEDSGKFDLVIEHLRNLMAEGHKALIFSSFVKHLELYTQWCDSEGVKYCYLTGEMPQQKREKVIKAFQEGTDVHLFFISIKAGGFGLNLTAADYVFITDPWWNPAVEAQAMSRAHRIGQKKNVFVYRFITKDTLEEKIHTLQSRKAQLAETFIRENASFQPADKEELLKLLE
jgi:SNF2 family DNA or RNA helicase